MRSKLKREHEACRVRRGAYGTTESDGMNGAFQFKHGKRMLRVIASNADYWEESGLDGLHWEHVSVSLSDRCPTWGEMDYVKRIFWGDDETVIQFHVPRSDHISYHDYCLHMWRPIGFEIPRPPSITVASSEDNFYKKKCK